MELKKRKKVEDLSISNPICNRELKLYTLARMNYVVVSGFWDS